jgi:hypothetical protein
MIMFRFLEIKFDQKVEEPMKELFNASWDQKESKQKTSKCDSTKRSH